MYAHTADVNAYSQLLVNDRYNMANGSNHWKSPTLGNVYKSPSAYHDNILYTMNS